MELEQIVQTLVYIHAGLGGLALIAGGLALFVKKGNKVHKKSGKVFFYSMLVSAAMAFIISILPNHENPFLFSIGLFSIYFIISGYRSLRYKSENLNLKLDKIISYLIILIGSVMILYPMILEQKLNIVLAVFGISGIIFGFRDLKNLKDVHGLKKKWLNLHLGKMTGGYIAAFSAFLVVNNVLPGIWNWFAPSIVGSVFIAYWIKKLNKRKPFAKD